MASIFPGRYCILRQCFSPSVSLVAQRSLSDVASDSEFRISEGNPVNHKIEDVGKFYTIPMEVAAEKIFKYGGWPGQFMDQCKVFNEACLMVRKPGLEIIHYLENADYSQPIHRYVLYGRQGNGKSLLLSYILHYGFLRGWLIVHLPWFSKWLSCPGEVSVSQKKEGFIDLNVRATEWLAHFRQQNSDLLKNNELSVENDYEWNLRESSKAGDSLLSLVEYGISRGTSSSEVVVALLNEVKQLSKCGKVKSLVLIDGFNAFFRTKTNIKDKNSYTVEPRKVSFLKPFYDITFADWHNGAVVVTVDSLVVKDQKKSILPLELLTLEGFEHLFPFIPVEVPLFTDAEFYNMLKYYRDRRWLREETGDEELKYLSCKNGYELMRICAPL